MAFVDGFARSELDGAVVLWLLDLEFAGRTIRISTRPAVVVDDSDTYQYTAGLADVRFEDQIAGFSAAAAAPSVSMAIVMPPGWDWGAEVTKGHDLSAARATLSQWREGTAYSARRVVVSGVVSSPVYGAPGEPMDVTVEASPFEDRSSLIETGAILSLRAFPDLALGQVTAYPTILGVPAPDTGDLVTTPGRIVDIFNRRLLIADDWPQATQVKVRNLNETGYSSALTITKTYDGENRRVSYVTLPTSGPAIYEEQAQYGVSWSVDGGGIPNRRRTSELTEAAEIIEWAFQRSTLDVDRGRMAAIHDKLRGYRLAGYVDDQEASTWDWLRTSILPILPVDVRVGPSGLYLVVYDWEASATDSIADLDAQKRGLNRVGGVEYHSTRHGRLANEIRVNYQFDVGTRKASRTSITHGDPLLGTGIDLHLSEYCRRSRIRQRQRDGRMAPPAVHSVDASYVYEAEVAAKVGGWMAAARALTSRRVAYEGQPDLGFLAPGDIVTITDTDVSLTSQACIVQSVTTDTTAGVRITLDTLER